MSASTRSKLKLISAATLTATVSSLLAPLAGAQTCDLAACPTRVTTHHQHFGLVSVAGGQDVVLNVVAVKADAPEPITPVCRVQVNFLSAGGAVLKTTTAELAPGQSTSLTLGRSGVGNRRLPVRAEVVASDTPEPVAQGRCKAVSSLEVFDTLTGRSSLLTGPHADVVTSDAPEPI